MDKKIKGKVSLKKSLIIGGISVAVIGVGGIAMGSSDTEVEKENTKITSEQTAPETKPVETPPVTTETSKAEESVATETSNTEEVVKLPDYKVEKVDNSNTASAVRETLHVVVNGEYTKDDLYKIAEKEIKDYTKSHKVNALTVGFYESADKIGKGYEMGRVEYVPNDDFSQAVKVKAGDYSTFKFVNHIQEKLKLPEPKPVESGATDLDQVKEDFETKGYKNATRISKEGNTLKVVVTEVEDLPWKMSGDFLISIYTDFCLDNIKDDIEVLDLTVKQPSDSARAVLKMSKAKDEGLGRFFESEYVIANLK